MPSSTRRAATSFWSGRPTMLPANDVLAMLMGTEAFLLALVDHPQWMAQAIVEGTRDQLAVRDEWSFRHPLLVPHAATPAIGRNSTQ